MAKLLLYFLPDEQERSKVSQEGGIVNGEASSSKPWKYDIRVQCHLRNSIDLRGSKWKLKLKRPDSEAVVVEIGRYFLLD